MTPTTDQLKDLLARASDGPWRISYERGTTQIRTSQNESIMGDETYYPWVPEHEADWEIIALAPTLAAEVVRLRVVADAFEELLATVEGECPSLVNEDSGAGQVLLNLLWDARQALDATSEK